MAGYTASFKDSLRTLIDLRPRVIRSSQTSCQQESPAQLLSLPSTLRSAPPVLPLSQALSVESMSAKAVESEMSTANTPVANAATAKKQTFLSSLGTILRNALHIGEEVAVVAQPAVQLAVPQVAPLYTSTLGLALTAEAALGSTPGTGLQKLDALAPQIIQQGQAWAKQNGIDWPADDVKKWAAATVATLNLIPALKL